MRLDYFFLLFQLVAPASPPSPRLCQLIIGSPFYVKLANFHNIETTQFMVVMLKFNSTVSSN